MAHRRFGGWTVYAGPVLEYIEAKVYRTTFSGGGVDRTEDTYYKKQSNLGAAGGLSWQHGGKRIGVEGGASGGGYSVGVEAALGF